jgi:hypothetical protein
MIINQQRFNYRECILEKLAQDGYSVELVNLTEDELLEAKDIKEEMKLNKNENNATDSENVANADEISEDELKLLESKKALTSEQRFQLRKAKIKRNYGIDVTTDLVGLDKDGFYNKLRLFYYLTVGREHLSKRDQNKLKEMTEANNNQIFKPDFNRNQLGLKVAMLDRLNVKQFFESGATFTKESLQPWLESVLPLKQQIKVGLGVTIR